MSLEHLLRDEAELIGLYLQEEFSMFYYDPADPTETEVRTMTEEEEMASDAIAQEDVEHRRNGYGAELDVYLYAWQEHQAEQADRIYVDKQM